MALILCCIHFAIAWPKVSSTVSSNWQLNFAVAFWTCQVDGGLAEPCFFHVAMLSCSKTDGL